MATMGLGLLGGDNVVFKRKFRWGLRIDTCRGSVDEELVKLASRPNISIEETEINMKNAKTWIPGKASWETITVTYYDLAGDTSVLRLYDWLATVYDFTSGIRGQLNMVDHKGSGQAGNGSGYAGKATLNLYNGCGGILETWELKDAWPQAINFGDLDYSSSEEVTVELTIRYSDVSYSSCNGKPNPCACIDCGQAQTGSGSFTPGV
jgi:hypothetical protein